MRVRVRGLLSEISISLAVLRCDVVKKRQIGRTERQMVTHRKKVCGCVHVEAGDTAEGAIAAAGALIVPSPQSCLRHSCGAAHQTNCITLACDRKHDYDNTKL